MQSSLSQSKKFSAHAKGCLKKLRLHQGKIDPSFFQRELLTPRQFVLTLLKARFAQQDAWEGAAASTVFFYEPLRVPEFVKLDLTTVHMKKVDLD